MNLQEMIDARDDLSRKISAEERRLREVRYRQNIANLDIKLEDVQLSSGNGMPLISDAYHFRRWMPDNSTKLFCEWNTLVYSTAGFPDNLDNPLCDMNTLRDADK